MSLLKMYFLFVALLIIPVSSFAHGHSHGGHHGGHGHSGHGGHPSVHSHAGHGHSHSTHARRSGGAHARSRHVQHASTHSGGGHGWKFGRSSSPTHSHTDYGVQTHRNYTSFHFFNSHHHGNSRLYVNDQLPGTHEITLGVGGPSLWQMFDDKVTSATPAYSLSYHYFVTRGFAIGVSTTLQKVTGDDICDCGGQPLPYNFTINTLTVALDMKWILYNKKEWQIYQGADIGILHYWEKDEYVDQSLAYFEGNKFSGQFTALGVRYGREVGVFVELGLGYKGIVSGGLSFEPGYWRTHVR